eukprot:scaffold5798_cov61-Attheya_sp.AAC.2
MPPSQFEDKEIDASMNFLLWLACCPFTVGAVPYKTTLMLDGEEVNKTDVNLCGKTVSRRPYGELGSVDKSNCLCCYSVTSGLGEIAPGCGCDEQKVDEIVSDLKQRMKGRGDTGQIARAEEQLDKIAQLEAKVDLILDHLNIPQPNEMDRTMA